MSLYKGKVSGGILQVPVLLLKDVKTDFISHCLLLSTFLSQYSYVLRHHVNLSYPISFHPNFISSPSPSPPLPFPLPQTSATPTHLSAFVLAVVKIMWFLFSLNQVLNT